MATYFHGNLCAARPLYGLQPGSGIRFETSSNSGGQKLPCVDRTTYATCLYTLSKVYRYGVRISFTRERCGLRRLACSPVSV